MRPRTIAIDGPAGSGKSTIGYALANRLGYAMLDTGVVYRLVAAEAIRQETDPDDESAVSDVAAQTLRDVQVQYATDGRAYVSFRGTPVQNIEELHTRNVSSFVPRVARHPSVRTQVKGIQRKMIDAGFTIVAGRDIGTVVAPDAELKLYLDVSLEERAARRMWSMDNLAVTQDQVQKDLAARDTMDKGRATSPLTVPPDALVVRTDKLSVGDTVEMIIVMCGISGHENAS